MIVEFVDEYHDYVNLIINKIVNWHCMLEILSSMPSLCLMLYHDYYVQNHASIIDTNLHLRASSIWIDISNLLYVKMKTWYKYDIIFITWSLGGAKAEGNKDNITQIEGI